MDYKRVSILFILTALCLPAFGNRTGYSADPPKGWFRAGSDPQNYEMSVDTTIKHGGKAGAYIKFIGSAAEGFGTLLQIFKADDYRGKRVRMSAWVKTEKVDSVQLWMRLDGAKSMLGFDNMGERAVIGTTEWKRYEIILDVPEATINIAFGALVGGKGQAWVDDFAFEVVGKDVPSTNMMTPEQMKEEQEMRSSKEYPKQPVNLNFEE